MKKAIGAMTAGLVAVGAAFSASAAGYPEKPITFVIPYSAGGSSDILVRGMQPFIEKAMGVASAKNSRAAGRSALRRRSSLEADATL